MVDSSTLVYFSRKLTVSNGCATSWCLGGITKSRLTLKGARRAALPTDTVRSDK